MRRLAALVLVALLAGCTRAPLQEEAEPLARSSLPAASAPAATVALVAAPVPELAVTLSVAERWVRPEDLVVATAIARSSQFEWYLATRNPLARPADAGPFRIEPTGAATLDVRREGRHVFALEGTSARLNVSIVPGAVALRLDVRLVDDGAGPRFAPEEALGGRGSVVQLVDERGEAGRVRRVDAMAPLGRGPDVSFLMTDKVDELGDYDLVVVARDGAGAVGEASARLIYDNRKPDAERAFGPFVGAFQLPPLAEPGRAAHAFESAHPLRSLDVGVTTTTGGPVAGAVRVTLLDAEGTPLGSSEAGGFALAELPAGDYGLVVEHLSGALVEYRVDVEGVWELTPPLSFFGPDR